MSKYAVVRINSKQYRVREAETILVDKLAEDAECEVLLVSDGDKLSVGKPVLEKAKVAFDIVEELVKGEKVRVSKFKAKSRYRKTIGSRNQYSRIKITKITS